MGPGAGKGSSAWRLVSAVAGFAGRALVGAAVFSAVLLSGGAARAAGEMLVDDASGLHYLEMTTQGAAPDEALPVVVALHGLGDNPASFRLLLEDLPARARVVIPRAPMPHGADGFSWFDFRGAAGDETLLSRGVADAAGRLAQLIASVATRRGGPARVVVTGFSQGGMLSFTLAASHPDRVAAAVPIAGYLPSPLWPSSRPTVRPLPKVLALHGEADRVIPLESARWSVEALRGNGYDATLRSFPGVKHSISTEMRSVLFAALVASVEELAPAGSVIEGPRPPQPWDRPAHLLPSKPSAAPAAPLSPDAATGAMPGAASGAMPVAPASPPAP